MNSKDFCKSVVTIPQYLSTCWFNAILMSILYSQNSRKLLLFNNDFKSKKTDLFKILYKILYKNYISPEKAQKYFKIMRPEVILKYVIKDKEFLNKIVKEGWFYNIFISKFIEIIGKTSIVFDYYDKKLFAGITENIDYERNLNMNGIEKRINDIKSLKNNPDYICVNIWDNLKNNVDTWFIKHYINPSITLLKDKHTLKKLNIPYSGLNKFENIITFNGDRYILDSCILANYNKHTAQGHAIVGLTCKNSGYVYNGWMRATIDPAKNDIVFKANSLPCELMKFDWDIHRDNSFCINPLLCNVNNVDKSSKNKIQCFSFNKGKRTLVYVKMNSNYLSFDKNKSLSQKSCPVGKILKEIKIERCVIDKQLKTKSVNTLKMQILKYKSDIKTLKDIIKDIRIDVKINNIRTKNMKNKIKELTSKSAIVVIRKDMNGIKKQNKLFKTTILEHTNKIKLINDEIKKLKK
jgi:hypothetical protein